MFHIPLKKILRAQPFKNQCSPFSPSSCFQGSTVKREELASCTCDKTRVSSHARALLMIRCSRSLLTRAYASIAITRTIDRCIIFACTFYYSNRWFVYAYGVCYIALFSPRASQLQYLTLMTVDGARARAVPLDHERRFHMFQRRPGFHSIKFEIVYT